MSRLSIHDPRSQNRSNYTRFSTYSYHNQPSSYYTSNLNQPETQAELVAFTPSLMSIRVPYQESQAYQHHSYRPRPYMYNASNEQTSLSTKTKSETTVTQPEYYVDSFASNFSDKPSSNSNNTKLKSKHVTFREPPEPSKFVYSFS